MRALRLEQFGSAGHLQIRNLPRPALSPGEALVEVRAAAINPSDVKNVQGMMAHTTLPRTPGRDFAGVVVDGPPDVVGTEVWGSGGELGFTRDGTHAEYLVLPREAVSPKPKSLSMEEAAAVGVPYVTAWAALEDAGRLTSGDTVVVIGAAGSVGSAAVQIAVWKGARVIGAVRDPGQREAVLGHGAADVVSTTGDFPQAVRDATGGRGASLVFDAAAGSPLLEASLKALANRGRLVEITVSGERRVSFDLMDFYRRDLRLLGVNTLALDVAAGARILEQLAPGFDSGALRPPAVAERLPLSDAAEGYRRIASGGARGKVVLTPW